MTVNHIKNLIWCRRQSPRHDIEICTTGGALCAITDQQALVLVRELMKLVNLK